MHGAVRRTGLLALYQLTVTVGILLMPVALLVRRAGISLPVRRIVEALGAAYDRVNE
jgi:hypothetical protein